MADRVVVVEVHQFPGHMSPGIRVGSTNEYNPNTKDQHTWKVYARFIPDADIATYAADVDTVAVQTGATGYP